MSRRRSRRPRPPGGSSTTNGSLLSALIEPLAREGRDRLAAARGAVRPAGSRLVQTEFRRRRQTRPDSTDHAADIGYELTTALLVRGDDGSPLAPMEMHLKTAAGVLGTRRRPQDLPHSDQVLPTMKAAQTWGLSKPLVHVIDREADSVEPLSSVGRRGTPVPVRGDDRSVEMGG